MRGFDWLKRRRLDEDDFQEEIRSHLAIATEERVADGADRDAARQASIKDFGNVTLDNRSGPVGLAAVVAGRAPRRADRRALRVPRARQEPRVLAHRDRRARARHRTEHGGVHAAQEPGAQPARRRRGLGPARRGVERDAGGPPRRPLVSRLSSTSATTIARSGV